jgi:hypothetical protein
LQRLLGMRFENRLLNKQGQFQLIQFQRLLGSAEIKETIARLKKSEDIISAEPVLRRAGHSVRFGFNRTFLVRFADDLNRTQISAINSARKVTIVKQIYRNTYLVQSAKNSDGLQQADQYREVDGVVWAQPNFYYLDWDLINATVNDPYWPQQWAHKNIGQTVASGAKSEFPQQVKGIPNADMDVDLAWDALAANGGQAGGSSDILVAMLDSGVDLTHPDLADNLFSTGKDFSPDQGDDASDVQGHGTATAGIVAAVGNNGIGVAGIAFNAQILPVKIFTTYGMASDADIAQAIDYAWQNGADILCDSWSGTFLSFGRKFSWNIFIRIFCIISGINTTFFYRSQPYS